MVRVCLSLLVVVMLVGGMSGVVPADEPNLQTGPWRAWLDSPGGELPFELELQQGTPLWRAWVQNGLERFEVPRVVWRGRELVFEFDLYQAVIEATPGPGGTRLDGVWRKQRAGGKTAELKFHATAGAAPRFAAAPERPTAIDGLAPRWAVRFEKDADPAVALFEARAGGEAIGTFLTPTGDYRYLAGRFEAGRLRLSCFDGSHAFLFDARLQPDATLAGGFWSGDAWHDRWTARPDLKADLPDAFAQTKWTGRAALDGLKFPDIWGESRSPADYPGKARIIQVFGTWCPNCHDETRYLVQLDRRYQQRGLSIVGLAFELSGDSKRDAESVRRFAARHGVQYPLLVAGVSDKARASAALPMLDRLRAYPTTIFLHGDGRIRAVHTGFAGPATGEAHRKLKAEFEGIIEELLDERPTSGPAGR